MDRIALITDRPFDVHILANGHDVTSRSPIASVVYRRDGTGTRTLHDGRTVEGRWRFVDAAQLQIEVEGPEGPSRWVVVELSDVVYRKVNLDTGVEFIHRPKLA